MATRADSPRHFLFTPTLVFLSRAIRSDRSNFGYGAGITHVPDKRANRVFYGQVS